MVINLWDHFEYSFGGLAHKDQIGFLEMVSEHDFHLVNACHAIQQEYGEIAKVRGF